jgi:flagellar protein FlgJ
VTGIAGLSGGVTPATPNAERDRLRQAAQAFEAVFLRQLIGSMRQAKLAEDPFGGASTEQFQEMADARLADSMSQQGSFGIAQMLLAQLERNGTAGAQAEPEAGTAAQLQARGPLTMPAAGQTTPGTAR